MSLMAHNGTSKVDELVVRAVPEPEFTKTWHPVGHAKVIDAFSGAVREVGLEIADKQYSLSASGGNMFGSWVLDRGDDKSSWALGVRNSTKKAFAIGVCAGQKVLVCDNMAFSGEFVEFRKHTSGLDFYELKAMAARAILKVTDKLHLFDKWVGELKEIDVPNGHFKVLTYNAMEKGVVSPSHFNQFLECHKAERDLNGDTLYAFHGAATRLMRGHSLFTVSDKNKALAKVVDEYKMAIGLS